MQEMNNEENVMNPGLTKTKQNREKKNDSSTHTYTLTHEKEDSCIL